MPSNVSIGGKKHEKRRVEFSPASFFYNKVVNERMVVSGDI